MVRSGGELADCPKDLLISLDEGNDSLSIIFGNVLSLITGDLSSPDPEVTKMVTFPPWS